MWLFYFTNRPPASNILSPSVPLSILEVHFCLDYLIINAISLLLSLARKIGMKAALFEIMMNGKLCRQSLNIYFQTFISFFGYYGTLYSATTLSGDPHINFILSLVCGIPGTFLYVLLPDRIGRKATLIMSELVLGISCMVGIFLQYYQLYPIVQIICSMAGRLVAGVAIKTCLIFMTEVFHTPIRSTAVSIGMVNKCSSSVATHCFLFFRLSA